MNKDLQSSLQDIFRDVFDDDQLQLQADMSPDTLPTWDSLGHIRLIAELEDTFQMSFTLEEIESMTSVSKIMSVLADKS